MSHVASSKRSVIVADDDTAVCDGVSQGPMIWEPVIVEKEEMERGVRLTNGIRYG